MVSVCTVPARGGRSCEHFGGYKTINLHTGTEMSVFTETVVKSCMVTKRIYIFLQHVFVGVMVDKIPPGKFLSFSKSNYFFMSNW